MMLTRILADRGASGGHVALLVNSLGATPLEELLILYRRAAQLLAKAGVSIARKYVGHHATSMEMAGCSMSIMDLDSELEALLDAPTACPFWPR